MKNDLIYYFAIGVITILNTLPRSVALKIAGFIGEVWYLLGTKDRNIANKQLKEALGFTGAKLKAHSRACFINMFKSLADVVRMERWTAEYIGSLVDVEGLEYFDNEYRKSKGIIALTGHISNFELLAAWFSAYKDYNCAAVGRKLYDERLNEMLVTQRERFGILNIPTDSSVKTIMKVLGDGYALGVLLDQDSRKVSGKFVEFFGKKALTAAGPIYIARKTGSPVVPMAIFRKANDRYLLKIMPPLEIEWTDDKETDIEKALLECNRALENLIKIDPDQWIWIHRRWRTRPEDKAEAESEDETEAE